MHISAVICAHLVIHATRSRDKLLVTQRALKDLGVKQHSLCCHPVSVILSFWSYRNHFSSPLPYFNLSTWQIHSYSIRKQLCQPAINTVLSYSRVSSSFCQVDSHISWQEVGRSSLIQYCFQTFRGSHTFISCLPLSVQQSMSWMKKQPFSFYPSVVRLVFLPGSSATSLYLQFYGVSEEEECLLLSVLWE